jgi:hypothetical protein
MSKRPFPAAFATLPYSVRGRAAMGKLKAIGCRRFYRIRENRRLVHVVIPYRLKGTMISVIGIRSDLDGTSRPLIDAIQAQGVSL